MDLIVTYGAVFLILAGVFGLFMAWGIGANDVANAMATSVGSRALTIKQAVLIAAVFAVWFYRRHSKRGEVSVKVSTHFGEVEQRIATELEAEMLRRTTSSQDAEA